MYSEAFEQLRLIKKSALDQVGLSYYYGAWMHLYGELGSYTERPGMQQVYYDQQNAYRDSVLMVAPEGTDDWYHMKMDILNGRRYYQEALQFSNRWIRNAPPNSHARAFAAFYRSMVYSNLHNEEQTRYWLGRSAIEDIKCGVMDQASLLFLAERLANDGDIERAQRYLEFSKKCNDYFCHHMRSYQVNSVIAIIEKSREAAEKRASLWFTVSMVVTALLLLTLIIVIIRKIKK
jgi:tetratricopeptide (TPR) repeat protein